MSAAETACTLVGLAEEGIISWESIARAAIAYMGERDLKDMAESEELIPDWCGEDE